MEFVVPPRRPWTFLSLAYPKAQSSPPCRAGHLISVVIDFTLVYLSVSHCHKSFPHRQDRVRRLSQVRFVALHCYTLNVSIALFKPADFWPARPLCDAAPGESLVVSYVYTTLRQIQNSYDLRQSEGAFDETGAIVALLNQFPKT